MVTKLVIASLRSGRRAIECCDTDTGNTVSWLTTHERFADLHNDENCDEHGQEASPSDPGNLLKLADTGT